MSQFIKIILTSSISLIAISGAYYTFYYIPQLDKKQTATQEKLKTCFDQADNEFYASWESICKEEQEEGRCSSVRGYPVYIQIQGVKDDAKKRCVQSYNL